MIAPARRLSWIPAACAAVVLGYRALVAAADVGREIGSIDRARIERAVHEPLDQRMDRALALPDGSLGAGRDARTFGARVRRLLVAETERDAGTYLLLPEESQSFLLYAMLSALLYPRVVIWVPEPSAEWSPARGRREALYVLDLEPGRGRGAATWKAHGTLVRSDGDGELWRVEGP